MPELTREHEGTCLLLPWYLNGTLEGEELQRVRQHLGTCLVCRQELTSLRRQVEFTEVHDQPLTSSEESFARLMHRIKTDKHPRRIRRLLPERFFNIIKNQWQGWMPYRPVWAVSLLLLTMTSGMLIYQVFSEPAAYRTLSDTTQTPVAELAAERTLRAVFDGSLNLDDFHKLLHECALTISAGPNSAGAYTLQAVAGDDGRQSALTCLRAKSGVRFAEPVMGGPGVD